MKDVNISGEKLVKRLLYERNAKYKGGLYYYLQLTFAYNSNKIEGSKLTSEQTQMIYERGEILPASDAFSTDDIVETINHFKCFDYILDTFTENLSEEYIKSLHGLLKRATIQERDPQIAIGDYKKLGNVIGTNEIETASPEMVETEMHRLLTIYTAVGKRTIDEIAEFHVQFERIHPFQDGNGRVGRLLMFKECLRNDIMPFVITDKNKGYYIHGISHYNESPEQLRETIGYEQEQLAKMIDRLTPLTNNNAADYAPETNRHAPFSVSNDEVRDGGKDRDDDMEQ
jgi:Fic family protein